MRLALKHCTFEVRDGAAWTRIADGAECANWIPDDGGHFAAIARDVGFTDPQAYLVQHELLHSLVPEALFDRPGYVVWMMAHGKKANLAASMAEERLIHYVALAACGSIPVVDPQWGEIIGRLRDLGLCGNPSVVPLSEWDLKQERMARQFEIDHGYDVRPDPDAPAVHTFAA